MGIISTRLWSDFSGRVIYGGGPRDYEEQLECYTARYSLIHHTATATGAFHLKDPGKIVISAGADATSEKESNYIPYGGKYYLCVAPYDSTAYSIPGDKWTHGVTALAELLSPYTAQKRQIQVAGQGYTTLLIEISEIGNGAVELDMSQFSREQLLSATGVSVEEYILILQKEHGYTTILAKNLDYNETTPETSIVSPSGQTLDNHGAITLQWAHSTDKGWPSYGYDLQYSYNGVVWTDLASVSPVGNTTPQPTHYTVPAYTFDVGVVYWRVRTYNTLDTAGEWAVGSFIAESAPDAPVIQSVTTAPAPTIRWTSTEQAAYRVAIDGLFDSGVIYGTDTSYTAPTVLPDGEHIVTLSVANASGKWTASTAAVTTANTPAGSIALTGEAANMAAALSWTKTGAFTRLYLLRDGVPVKDVTGLSGYTDALYPGSGVYIVRGLLAGGNYTDSNAVTITEDKPRGLSIVPLAAGGPLRLRYNLGAFPAHSSADAALQEYTHYAGRTLPVASLSGFRDVTHTLNYAIESGQISALSALIGKAVCVRDRYGRVFGVLESAQRQNGKKYTALTLALTEIDYQEAVDYVVV